MTHVLRPVDASILINATIKMVSRRPHPSHKRRRAAVPALLRDHAIIAGQILYPENPTHAAMFASYYRNRLWSASAHLQLQPRTHRILAVPRDAWAGYDLPAGEHILFNYETEPLDACTQRPYKNGVVMLMAGIHFTFRLAEPTRLWLRAS